MYSLPSVLWTPGWLGRSARADSYLAIAWAVSARLKCSSAAFIRPSKLLAAGSAGVATATLTLGSLPLGGSLTLCGLATRTLGSLPRGGSGGGAGTAAATASAAGAARPAPASDGPAAAAPPSPAATGATAATAAPA